MTGLALGLMWGAGLFLVWSSFWVPPAERRVTRNRMRDRLADEIVQSGIPGLGVGIAFRGVDKFFKERLKRALELKKVITDNHR